MAGTKAPQYRGTYHVRSLANLRTWNADPTTRCYVCHRTISEVRQDYPKAKWHNGHRWPNDPAAPLDAWCSRCNIAESNRRRGTTTPLPEHLRW